MGEQVPIVPVSAQEVQTPAQAVAQQTPCAQWPEPQSESAAQTVPGIFFWQTLAMQKFPVAQSASTAQLVLQTPVVSQT
jgi:hypothetical protein